MREFFTSNANADADTSSNALSVPGSNAQAVNKVMQTVTKDNYPRNSSNLLTSLCQSWPLQSTFKNSFNYCTTKGGLLVTSISRSSHKYKSVNRLLIYKTTAQLAYLLLYKFCKFLNDACKFIQCCLQIDVTLNKSWVMYLFCCHQYLLKFSDD